MLNLILVLSYVFSICSAIDLLVTTTVCSDFASVIYFAFD